MGSNRHRAWRLAIATAVIVGMAVTVPATQASGPKNYSATSNPTSLVGGAETNVTITLANTTVGNPIDFAAANVVVPTGLTTVGGPTISSNAPGFSTAWTATYNTSTRNLELRNMDVPPSYWVAVTQKVRSCAAGTYTWTTDVRQSNKFNGTLNKFNNDGSDPTTPISASSVCKLAFTGQPADTFPGQTITQSTHDPSGSAVTVQAQTGAGDPLTWWTNAISLGKQGGDSTASLTGGSAVSQSSGTATFAPSIDKASATAYQLTASSIGLTAVPSNAFLVQYSVTTTCAVDGQVCTTGDVPGPSGSTGNVTVVDSDTLAGDLTAAFVANNVDCGGYEEFGDNLFFDVNVTNGVDVTGMTKTVTLSKPIPSGRPHVTGTDEWRYQVCLQSRTQFEALPTYSTDPQSNYNQMLQALSNGDYTDPAEVVPTTARVLGDKSLPEYRGLLASCSLTGVSAPCLVSVTFGPATAQAPNGTATFVTSVPVADPQMR